jgi:hypothetical protein
VTPVTFVLIVSAIVSGHGQTIAARQDSLTACIEAKVWYESLLAHHGVRPLASKCQAQMRFPSYVEEVPRPEGKPFKTSKKRRITKRISRSCYMKYHYIHHRKHWFCARRR